MKKSLLLLLLLPAFGPANAQGAFMPFANQEVFIEMFRSVVVLGVVGLLAAFVLALLRLLLAHRLKKQLLEASASVEVIDRLLPTHPPELNGTVKGVFLLVAVGAGLTVGSFYQPWGVHSAIILVFSLALGFLGYYFFLKRQVR